MALRVVGAGLGRTGTSSLKFALQRLLGTPCYHMMEVFTHPEHIPLWHAAAHGRMPDWQALFAGFGAAVDWPAAAFWPELSAAFPDALVLLSVREPQSWWQSASETIFPGIREQTGTEWHAMVTDLLAARFTSAVDDPAAAIATFERHNARVRATVPAQRLVEWRAADGWGPLCTALGMPVPSEPFPHTNTRADWQARRE
jgi:hypothetical protein